MEPTRADMASVADVFSHALRDNSSATASSNAQATSGVIGGFLVCLDVPEATEFGIDYEVFRTGPKFQGVKFVPLGVHFVVFRSKDHEHGIRQGFFVHVKQHGQVIAREWSAEKEELGPPRLGLNVEHLENAVRSFQLDAGLGPYPKQHAKVWHRLSQYISETVLQRCGVETGAIIVPGGVDDAALDTGAAGVVPFFADQPRTVRFTTLRRRDVSQMTAAERTAYNFDKSAMLVDTLTQDFGGAWQDLLGEFQLAFVVFLQLSSLAALEQWKQMVFLLCSCESALTTHTALFVAFVKALRTQLQQIPVDFFEDEVADGNFLRPCLASLLEVLSDCDFSQELSTQRNRLTQLLQTRFRFAAHSVVDESEMDEFAPTIVSPEELLMDGADVAMAPAESNEAIALAFLRSQQLKGAFGSEEIPEAGAVASQGRTRDEKRKGRASRLSSLFMKTPPPQTQAQPNGVAPPQPQAHAQAQQPPPHVNAHARPFQPQPHHYPQHPYAQHPHDAMGPPRGAPHFEYRPKGDFPDQMPHLDGGADMPPPPFKPGVPLQPHARPYPGPGFIPNNGVPPQFRGPPGPHGYQQRMRGPPRGVPGGMPQQNYPPRGAMPHPRGQPHYAPYMQQPMHHPGPYGLPPGVPGGPPYMPPPGAMPGYPGVPGVPGPGMGMGMPMNMPPPHAHTAHVAPPPQQREKKVLTIMDPKTGLPITFKGAAAAASTTPATGSAPSTPAKPVESAPSPVVKPQPAVKQPPVMDEAPRAAKSPAKKTAKPSNNVNAGDEMLAKVKALMEAKKNGTTPVETPAPATEAKKAPVAPASPKKAEPVKKTEAVASPAKKREPATAPAKKAEPVPVAAKKPQPEVVASPKKTPLSPNKAPESPKKAPESPKKTPESPKKAPESPKKTPVAATTPVSSPKRAVEKSASPKKKVVISGDLINSVGVKENGKFTYTRDVLRLFRELYTELPEDAKDGDLKWPTMEIVTESTGRTRGGGRGGRGGRGADGEAGGPGWDRGSEKPGLNRQSSRSGGGGSNWQRSQDLPKRDRDERGGRGGRGGGRGGRGGRGQQEPLFDGPVKPLERSDNRWIPVKAESNLEAAKKKVQSIMNKMTREKFDKLAAQIVEINMDSLEMLQGVIKILFDKALGEPHFCDMYADLCVHLESSWKVWSFLKIVQNDDDKKFYWTTMAEADSEVVGPFTSLDDALDACGSDEFEPVQAPQTMKLHEVRIREGKFVKLWVNEQDDEREFYWSGQLLEDIGEEQILNGPYDSHELASRYSIKATSFKRILLNACQEEFEKDNIYEELEEKFKKDKEEGTMSAEAIAEYEEKRIIMKGRMLGNIRFIGELYRKGMLQERIMHECISKLMGVKTGNGAIEPSHPGNAPDEESIESLCKLLSTMGKDLERSNSSAMGMYFAYLEKKLVKDKRLSSRITFMIQDVIELRGNRWEPRRKELKSKSLDEIRKEAEREAQREQQRPPASAPSGGGRPDAFRMDGRRSNSSRDGGFSQRSTMAPVYSSQSMNSRSSGANKMQLPSRGIQRDDSVKTGPQGRPASFGSGARGQARAPPASAPGPVLGKQNSRGGRGGSGPSTPKHGGAKEAAPVVASLSEDDKEAIEKKSKSIAEEYVSIVDLTEADTCYQDLLKQFKSHADVPGLVATGVLKLAIEAKADAQRAMFDLLEKLSVEKSSLSFEGIRVGIKETIAFGNDLWCDVPKLHENLADFIVRFAKISEKTGVTLDWLMGSCLESVDAEIYEEIIQGGFLAEVCGCTLKSLKTINLEKANTLVRNTHVTLLSLFPDYKQNAQDFKKWLDKHQIGEALALQPAVDFAEHWVKTKDLEETVKWYQDTVPESVKKDPVFVSLACVLVLGSLKKGSLPSDDEGMLFNGLCVSVESQTRLVAALFQTHGAVPDDAAAFKALLTHLVKEQHSIPSVALSKWLELKNDTSVGRKRALAAFGDFVEDLVKKTK